MKNIRFAVFAAALLVVAPARAQWQTPNHSVPIGRGAGVQGFGYVPPGVLGQPFVSTGPTTDPAFGNIANSGFAAGAANTYKGSLNGTSVADVPIPDCQAANTAIRYAAGSGPLCGNVVVQTGFDAPVNLGLSSSAVGGALTINVTQASGSAPTTASPVLVPFRSTTLSSGSVSWGTVSSSLSLTVPSGASLGTSSNIPFRVWIFLAANGGTPALGVATCSNASTIFPCTSWEYTLKTTVSISAGATNGGTLYVPTGVTLDAVRIIGYCDFSAGLATAGTYASACTGLQVFGPGVKKPGDPVQSIYVAAFTQAITPSSTINKIKFAASYNCNVPLAITPAAINFLRGVTPLWAQSLAGSGGTGMYATAALTLLDSPNTAAPVTYSMSNTGTNCGSALGTIVLDEIMG